MACRTAIRSAGSRARGQTREPGRGRALGTAGL